MRKLKYAVIALFIMLLASGCGVAQNAEKAALPLKVGLMPAVDAAPILLAEKNGYFGELGLKVELEIYNNAQNRQSALQAQAIDGAMTDLIAVAANVDAGFDIKATTMTNGVFPILSRKGSEDKKDIKVGMMQLSVSNFLADEWLVDKYKVEKVYINEIPARLAAIGSGQLDMGVFPEPVASMGELKGLDKKIYDTRDNYCPDVMVFTGKALKDKSMEIRLFHKAYDKAVAEISKNPQLARDIMMERIPNLKPEIKDMIVLPAYSKVSLPDEEYIQKVIDWTAAVVSKDLKVKPKDIVETGFVKP